MADLAEVIHESSKRPDETESSQFLPDLVALLTAINYFSRRIAHLKRMRRSTHEDEEVKLHLAELYDRLKEVTYECRSI